MLLDPLTLGKRIQYFRKRAHMSQLNVESAIEASPGMLSRIENGTVNATKETLQNIISELNLNQVEADYLIGPTALPVSDTEAHRVIESVRPALENKAFMGYIVDDRLRIVYSSSVFRKLLDIPDKSAERVIGKTVLEVMLKDDFGIKNFLDEAAYMDMVRHHIAAYKGKVGHMFDDSYLLDNLTLLRENSLINIWNNAEVENQFLGDEVSVMTFKKNGKKMKMEYSIKPLFSFPRFELVEYRPTSIVNRSLIKLTNQIKN